LSRSFAWDQSYYQGELGQHCPLAWLTSVDFVCEIQKGSVSNGHEFGYEAVLRHIGNLAPTASIRYGLFEIYSTRSHLKYDNSIRHASGGSVKSSLFQNWTHDSRDNNVMTTKGAYLRISQELAGLGGDASFYKAESEAQLSRRVLSNSVSRDAILAFFFSDRVPVLVHCCSYRYSMEPVQPNLFLRPVSTGRAHECQNV
jgi:Omp85 superfamily domain